jgi:hypothetical protein
MLTASSGPMPIPMHGHAISRTPSHAGMPPTPTSLNSALHYPTTPTMPHPIPNHQSQPSPQSSTANERSYCTFPNCLDKAGHPRSFSRKADVARHIRSAHEKSFIDCPFKKCPRRGMGGFTRNDHLMEHRRQYHMEALPKKSVRNGVAKRTHRRVLKTNMMARSDALA